MTVKDQQRMREGLTMIEDIQKIDDQLKTERDTMKITTRLKREKSTGGRTPMSLLMIKERKNTAQKSQRSL